MIYSILGAALALIPFVYFTMNDPDDSDPKWDINNAPWNKD